MKECLEYLKEIRKELEQYAVSDDGQHINGIVIRWCEEIDNFIAQKEEKENV